VAKAAAAESGANFMSIKGPELLNKYVGESERAVRQLFSRARAAAPCVLFFDEMDALAPRRGSDLNQSTERVVNQVGGVCGGGGEEAKGAEWGRWQAACCAAATATWQAATCRASPADCAAASAKAGACPRLYEFRRARPCACRPPPQLLTEMDGIEGRAGVYLVAATNRPDMIDPALLRPGRLDKVLYVPLPPPGGRASILRALTRRTPLAPGVDLEAVGAWPALTGFSGADLAALVREACVAALREGIAAAGGGAGAGVAGVGGADGGPPLVHPRHFEAAARAVQPSVSRQDQRMYDALRLRLRSSRGHLRPEEGAAAPTPSEAAQPAAADEGGAAEPADMVSAGGGEGSGAPMEEDAPTT
jgi:SpoVK/Ycf46/Vps4 family AAA+-type ATPase